MHQNRKAAMKKVSMKQIKKIQIKVFEQKNENNLKCLSKPREKNNEAETRIFQQFYLMIPEYN